MIVIRIIILVNRSVDYIEDNVTDDNVTDDNTEQCELRYKYIINPKKYNKTLDDTICIICLEQLNKSTHLISLLECNHLYHYDCIHKWFEEHNNCPICNKDISDIIIWNNI